MSSPVINSDQYQQQLAEKHLKTLKEFSTFGISECEVYPSPHKHYRMRAEFKAWHENGQVHYAMYHPGEYKKPYTIEEFEPGSSTINALMPTILEAINSTPILSKKLFQIEFLTSTIGEAIVTLIYHKSLDEEWNEAATSLHHSLGINIIGRARKQKLVIGYDHIHEEFKVNTVLYRYKHVEASFTQPNASICQDMLNWAQNASKDFGGDLLELYCGNGNFTLPLSKNFNKVLATEISKSSVNSALDNIRDNNIHNIAIARMSSEELTEALNNTREFRRLKIIDINSYHFSTAFVDPPRAGLDTGTTRLIQKFSNIIYISCNPETLVRDLITLSQTHDVAQLALFDQFPYTDHRECGVILRKRQPTQ